MKKRHITILLVSILTLAAAGGVFYYLHQNTEARPPQNHREAREKRPKNKLGKGQTKKKKQPAAENKASGSKGSVAPTPPEKVSAPEEAPTIPSELSQEEKDNRLYDAANQGNVDLVRQYLAAGANPNRRLPRPVAYPIIGAAENGHTDCLQILLDSGADPDIDIDANPIFLTAIFRAARNGHADCLEALIKAGADINVVKQVTTPLHLAAENGHTECVALLIRAGARLDAAPNRTTALYEATRKGHIECAKMLLDAGANPTLGSPNAMSRGLRIPELREAMIKAEAACNTQAIAAGLSQQEKNDRLAKAVFDGNAILVRRYLAAGADVKAVLNAHTRFDEDLPEDCEAIYKMLMEADGGASAEYFDLEHPNTRLFLAAGQGDTELVKKLMKEGADIHATNSMNQWTALHHAAIRGRADCLTLLLKAGAKVNQPDRFGRTPLYWAAFNSHTECVKMLLKAKADAKSADSDNRTALYWAAERGNADCVKMLIKAGADVEQCYTKGRLRFIESTDEEFHEQYSPLYWTALWGHADCMKLLIDAGADVNKDTDRRPALHLAAQGGHADCVKLLLEAGADVNKVALLDEHTPLFYAASEGHEECVRLLLKAPGIDVNKDKRTLSRAIMHGHTECVRLLLAAPGLNLNQYPRGHNPLLLAFAYGRLECAKLLMNAPGLDMDKAVNDAIEIGIFQQSHLDESQKRQIFELLLAHPSADINRTGALIAAAETGHEVFLKMCLDKPGTDVNLKNKNGIFPLLAAARKDKVGCLQMLLDAPGIEVNAGTGQWTALHGAVANNCIVCVELLLNAKGIDVNAESSTGDTALHQAVSKDYSKMQYEYSRQQRIAISQWGQATCMRLLLNAQGIDVNKVNNKGQTALWLAVFNNNVECVRLLLNAPGININQPDATGKSPLDLASEKKHDECLKLLREAAKH